jgi:hypothetical protein
MKERNAQSRQAGTSPTRAACAQTLRPDFSLPEACRGLAYASSTYKQQPEPLRTYDCMHAVLRQDMWMRRRRCQRAGRPELEAPALPLLEGLTASTPACTGRRHAGLRSVTCHKMLKSIQGDKSRQIHKSGSEKGIAGGIPSLRFRVGKGSNQGARPGRPLLPNLRLSTCPTASSGCQTCCPCPPCPPPPPP